jgi:hypothetical protein
MRPVTILLEVFRFFLNIQKRNSHKRRFISERHSL